MADVPKSVLSAPDLFLPTLELPMTILVVWIRVVGTALVIGILLSKISDAKQYIIFQLNVFAITLVFISFILFELFKMVSALLIGIRLIDFLGSIWKSMEDNLDFYFFLSS